MTECLSFSGLTPRAKQTAEKGPRCGENGPTSTLQGLKPADFIGFIGTTEVMPCYRTSTQGGPQFVKPLILLLHQRCDESQALFKQGYETAPCS
jgi:hypothetical protein